MPFKEKIEDRNRYIQICGIFDILYICISIIPKNHAQGLQYVTLTLSNSYLKLINLQNTNLFPMTGIIIQV